jgi:hypothetical protein
MVNRSDGTHDLYVGAARRQLNEYVVVESPTRNTVYSADARKYSSPDDSGYDVAVQVRQRGKENPETITLVLSPDKLAEFAGPVRAFRTGGPQWGRRSFHGSQDSLIRSRLRPVRLSGSQAS